MARPKPAVVEGRVRDLTHGGDAVVESSSGIVLARGALPGEQVRVRVTGRAGGVLRATLLARLESSEARREPPCPEAERCGGCPLMPWAESAQVEWKRARLARVLEHAGSAIEPAIVTGPSVRYRLRARLAWRATARGAALGYHAAASLQLIDVADCLVLREELARGYAVLRERLGLQLAAAGEIALGLGAAGACVAELTSDAPQPPGVYAAAEALVAEGSFAGLSLRVGHDGARATWGDARQRAKSWDGDALWAPPGGFVQANAELNLRLVEEVRKLAEPAGARVLELYAGYGNFSVALAPGATELRAVESDRDAVAACNANLAARGLGHARALCADAAEGARGTSRIDVAVLDPPRAGAKDVLEPLAARGPARIVYVSCDPTTLRRDLGVLRALGYRVDAALGFDMFPQTTHLESVVRLQREEPRRRTNH